MQALSWDVPNSGTPAIKVEVLQSNYPYGPFALWGSPSATGATVTNTVTITTVDDGAILGVTPSLFYQLRLTNLGASANVTVDVLHL